MNSIIQTKVYPKVGHCIYCGVTNSSLSKEHIIPLGLGGNWILLKSSCSSCAKITGKFEQFLLHSTFGPLRIKMNLPTRHKKNRPDKLPLEYIRIDGNKEHRFIPSQEFPFVCTGFQFPLPSILTGIHHYGDTAGESKLFVQPVGDEIYEHMHPHGQRVKIGSFSILLFTQMLAKIAHSYAIAELGETAFNPLLPDFILNRPNAPHHSYLVGGSMEPPPEKEPILHRVGKQYTTVNGIEYIVVTMRLFALFRMPVYHVVVGEKL